VFRSAADVVTGADFEDARLGAVFDGIGAVLSGGGSVNQVSVESFYPDWDVRGLNAGEPHNRVEAAGMYPAMVKDHARIVRADSLRRAGSGILSRGLADVRDSGVEPATVLERVSREIAGVGTSGSDELAPVLLGEILDLPDKYDWVIPDLMERFDRLIITGHEGLGKSTFARQLLLLPAAGLHPFTREPIAPVRSLVIDAENTAKQWKRNAGWLRNRCLEVGTADPAETVMMVNSGRINVLKPQVMGEVHRMIDRHDPPIVFVGPLYRITPSAITNDSDAAEVIAALDTIRDRGVALVIEAHAGHALGPNGHRDVRPRGSSALMGWPEFGLGIRSDMEDPKRYELVPWRGSREERDWPVALRRGEKWPWEASE
jgi:replicative DNA helicase